MKHIENRSSILFIILFALSSCISKNNEPQPVLFYGQGNMAGEITESSIILQSRLTLSDTLIDDDLPGTSGFAKFELAKTMDFNSVSSTDWMEALPENDFIIKVKINHLDSDTRYYYRLIYGKDSLRTLTGVTCLFRTLPGKESNRSVSFAIVTGMNYEDFYLGPEKQPERAYKGPDKLLGFPGLKSMKNKQADFIVFTGDNVYYDKVLRAETQKEMRRKWHKQFVQPRFIELFSEVPGYWEKDDHDYRFNDCDTLSGKAPSGTLGINTFREQVPVTDPLDKNAVTYRTFRINKDLQIWLPEGRDYRSPNAIPDGPDKSIWGKKQLDWLKRTLLQSDARFKILISPTPMIGPDDAYKSDNHVNQKGFRHEGDLFINWLKDNDFLNKGFYFACGDRHWQYHSIHPSGFEEFSCGALVDANSRAGRMPGDPSSTDPEAKIVQPYVQGKGENSGGFLFVRVKETDKVPTLSFEFYDEYGSLLYKTAKN
ncbi:MAG: alkaline phosphatase D family protein [Bacteroidales bacterium]|nr:alkaline phosphatase D family protein [Bacteroidales bacterium]